MADHTPKVIAAGLVDKTPPTTEGTDEEIVLALTGYKQEAEMARKSGPNGRDEKWDDNLNLYWNRFDFSGKAAWQAKEVMPEVPAFVDRFAAALKEALVAVPEGFYTIEDPADTEGDLSRSVKRITDVWLSRCGRNQNGHILGFPAVFEEQVKMGALMAMSAVVTWKKDSFGGRVAIETVDPRNVWLDHTYRNLYRIRRIELDKHELTAMINSNDKKGKSIFNVDAINMLLSTLVQEELSAREELTGHGQQITSSRKPIILDEYIATVLDMTGEVIADNALLVVANDQFLIRGPEKNPFWHGQDWLLYAPLVTSPLSVYGRSYMEDFGSVAKTFNELTNMILDAVFTSSMKAFALAPGMLLNPDQAQGGIHPNKLFLLEEGIRPSDFFDTLDLGTLPSEAVRVWGSLKDQLKEAAGMNEIGLGQFAPNSRTSATEVNEAQSNSGAIVRSIAQTVETRWLDPCVDMVWKTGLQHARKDDKMLADAAGPEMYAALIANRRELIKRPLTFQARGISTMIKKSRMLQSVLRILQIVGSNEVLLKEFLQVADMSKLIELLFELSDIDMKKLKKSDRDKLIAEQARPLEQAQADAANGKQGSAPKAGNEAQELASLMGIA